MSQAVRARAEMAKRKRGGETGRLENGVEEEEKRARNRAMPPQKRKVRARVSKRAP